MSTKRGSGWVIDRFVEYGRTFGKGTFILLKKYFDNFIFK
jgi:hypothetical protein